MDVTCHKAQRSRCWFDRHAQLLKQHDADATRKSMGNKLSTSDEVIETNYFWNGLRIYMRNVPNIESMKFPGSYDFIACGHQTVNLKRLVGHGAVVCLKDGRLVVREIKRSKKRGHIDLYDYSYGPDPIIMPEVDTYWAAPLWSTMPYDTWDYQLAHGWVKILRDLHWPEGAGRA